MLNILALTNTQNKFKNLRSPNLHLLFDAKPLLTELLLIELSNRTNYNLSQIQYVFKAGFMNRNKDSILPRHPCPSVKELKIAPELVPPTLQLCE